MTEISLSKDSLNQAQEVLINPRIYKIFYDTDTKLVHYSYTTHHRKYPTNPSPFWSDYEDITHCSGVLNILKIFKDGDIKQSNSPEGLVIRRLNNSENKFILECIPVDSDTFSVASLENHMSAEVLKIEFHKLGINCDVFLEKFEDVTKVRYKPIKVSDVLADYTYNSRKRKFNQFVIVPNTETDLVQFLFYFNDYIRNSVWIS